MHLTYVPEDRWPVVVQQLQHPPEVLEHFYYLSELHIVLPCEAEGHLQSLVRNIHIPSPPPHMSVIVTSCRPLVFDEPPRWHVHYTQVTAGSGSSPLLSHQHLGPKVALNEVLLELSSTMSYRRTPRHRKLHLLQCPGEGHHISGRPYPYPVDPPHLGDADAMDSRHVRLYVQLRHCHTALGATHPRPLPLPKS